MKNKLIVALSFVAGVVVISVAADLSGAKPQTDHEVVQELRTQIIDLRAKIETLEGRTQSLESRVEQLKQSHEQAHSPTPLNFPVPAPAFSIPSVSAPRPPTIWGQGEVNGWTYYVVPCGEQGR